MYNATSPFIKEIKIMSSINVDNVTILVHVSVTENYWAICDASWVY